MTKGGRRRGGTRSRPLKSESLTCLLAHLLQKHEACSCLRTHEQPGAMRGIESTQGLHARTSRVDAPAAHGQDHVTGNESSVVRRRTQARRRGPAHRGRCRARSPRLEPGFRARGPSGRCRARGAPGFVGSAIGGRSASVASSGRVAPFRIDSHAQRMGPSSLPSLFRIEQSEAAVRGSVVPLELLRFSPHGQRRSVAHIETI